ncbi:nitroreductase [Breoghania sp. L-A4]|uniref:nitroreductase family protein n=1 Tax=Breoghania sp. L-A4 TaxID=2304600 RepID=UPI000E360822|nr:nitroreductase [Breoghania sp. L-A4]AXS41090.1 nitroreductase [Breoghania sp. L-A4]
MPDALDLLLTRRSIPAVNLGDPGPDAEQLRRLLTIGARVPDHGKLAPWRFIVFQGDARTEAGEALCALRLAREPDLDAAQQEQERTRLSRAPLVIGVVSTASQHAKIPVWEQELSAGAVCMNLATAAHALGFVSQWLTEWYAHDAEAAALLGLRDGERFAGFIHIGTPKEPPFERPRPDIDALTTHWSKD